MLHLKLIAIKTKYVSFDRQYKNYKLSKNQPKSIQWISMN